MSKGKVLSSPKATSSSPLKPVSASEARATPASNIHKDALQDIVNISAKLDKDPTNRNFRIMLQNAIAKAKDIL
jgi:hypothetical protein